MFPQTGVTEPKLDVADLDSRASTYEGLRSSAATATTTVDDNVRAVLAVNKGDTADAFERKAVGAVGLSPYLVRIQAAADRTSVAYRRAAADGGADQTAMVAYAKEQHSHYVGAVLALDFERAARIVNDARTRLRQLEAHGSQAVKAAFGFLQLPVALELGYEQGRRDTRIDDEWRRMTTGQQKAMLQAIADKYAEDNGFPPIAITYKEKEGVYGYYVDGSNELVVVPSRVGEVEAIATVIHEMQHRRQAKGQGFRWPWQDVKNGMTREEAARWGRLEQDHVTHKGDDPATEDNEAYWQQPAELDSRRAEADYLNQLGYDDFMALKEPNGQRPSHGGTPTLDFSPPVWQAAGENVRTGSDTFYRAAEPVVIMKAFASRSSSPIETEAVAGDARCLAPWHRLIAGVHEHMSGLGSQMVATGTDYAATEEDAAAAAVRFWR